MRIDIEEKTQQFKNGLANQMELAAEYNAEVYVSSTLGMEEGAEKENKKTEYIDNFINELKRII